MQRGYSMNSENSLKSSKTRYLEMVFADHHYPQAEETIAYSRKHTLPKFFLRFVSLDWPSGNSLFRRPADRPQNWLSSH
jgi:hypothetical protein